MTDRRRLMQDVRARYLAMALEEDDGRHRVIVEATNAVENIFLLAQGKPRSTEKMSVAA